MNHRCCRRHRHFSSVKLRLISIVVAAVVVNGSDDVVGWRFHRDFHLPPATILSFSFHWQHFSCLLDPAHLSIGVVSM